MVKTRTTYEEKEFSDDENDESIALRKTRSQQKLSTKEPYFHRSSDKLNGCESLADGSTSGHSVMGKRERDSDDSFQPTKMPRMRRQMRRYQTMIINGIVNNYRNGRGKGSQPNVRRSNRRRKTLFKNMNESLIESANHRVMESYSDINNGIYYSVNNHRNSLGEKPKKKPGYHELKRLGLGSDIPSDVEDDMYSKVKTSPRKLNTNPDAGIVADTEETEEMSDDEIIPKRRLRRRTIAERESSNTASSETESSESEEILESRRSSKYCLRPKRQVTQKIDLTADVSSPRGPRNQSRYHHHHHRSFGSPVVRTPRRRRRFDSGSSSDESRFERRKSEGMMRARNRCLPMNLDAKDTLKGILRDRQTVGCSLADIDPMDIDRSLLFDSIGGLDTHIKSLKEMVLFPLLYPEVFAKYKIQPPRGVLFHGPPGTGKTLVARALANECSQGDRKVAFFMRKGADCLSKWVGESERQLRMLFDQAYLMRPSIIFFDEIDGIAPVRSTRQDQIHSSIVSTLLALMDGLDNRGEVIVIGATNRIEAIDPALRRPGRFDREFYFPLPSLESRSKILEIHSKEWNPPLSPSVINTLAVLTVNYCGADLKALCAEAALIALKRRYPQIYKSRNKLQLNMDEIRIEMSDFAQAMKKLVPAAHRSSTSCSRPLSIIVKPLLNRLLKKAIEMITEVYPAAKKEESPEMSPFFAFDLPADKTKLDDIALQPLDWVGNLRPRILIHGQGGQGQSSYLGPAILHHLEGLSHLKLDLPTLYSVSTRTPEESLANIFLEAYKRIPSIIYIPRINKWWNALTETLRTTLCTLIDDMESNIPILILVTSDCHFDELPDDLQDLFRDNRSSKKLLEMSNPSRKERETFFLPLFETFIYKEPILPKTSVLEELPLAAPPEPRKLTEKEIERLRKKEEATLRELRLFLREVLGKILKDRRFSIFVKPVDIEEVPDYLEVIKTPMALETMMTNIDMHKYQSTSQFLKDIDLICYNALEYNPDRDPTDKMIRHRACALKDTAYAFIDEVHSEFEDQCREIVERRAERGESSSVGAPSNYRTAPPQITSEEKQQPVDLNDEDTEIESNQETVQNELPNSIRTKKRGVKAKVLLKKLRSDEIECAANVRKSSTESMQSTCREYVTAESGAVTPHGRYDEEHKDIVIDRNRVSRLLERAIDMTNGCNVDQLEELYTSIFRLIAEKRNEWIRTSLEKEIAAELDKFERLYKRYR